MTVPLDAFEDLKKTIRRLIWVTAAALTIVSAIAISGVSLAWYGLRNQVHDNERTIIAMCRQNNAQNKDLRTILLFWGVQPAQLFELRPIICDKEGIKERIEN